MEDSVMEVMPVVQVEVKAASGSAETAPYPFNADYEVRVNITPGATEPRFLCHRFRRPSLAELNERERNAPFIARTKEGNEEEIKTNSDAADIAFYNKIIVTVTDEKTGRVLDIPSASDKDAALLRNAALNRVSPLHKLQAVHGIYHSRCVVEYEDVDDVFAVSGGVDYSVKQVFGNPDNPTYLVYHKVHQPGEKELLHYRQNASSVSMLKGAMHPETKVYTNLSVSVDLYDKFCFAVENAEISDGVVFDVSNSNHRSQMDPFFKAQVMTAVLKAASGDMGK